MVSGLVDAVVASLRSGSNEHGPGSLLAARRECRRLNEEQVGRPGSSGEERRVGEGAKLGSWCGA
jgi:hypothetical protein